MSRAHTSTPASQSSRYEGLPLWSALAIMVAAHITGLLLSVYAESLGAPYYWIFAIAAVTVTIFVRAQGLFITVVCVPIFYSVFTVVTSWLVAVIQAPDGADPFSTTAQLSAIYPLAQYFPWLFWVTVICIVIAVARVLLLRRAARIAEKTAAQTRRRLAEQDREHARRTVSARRHSQKISVQELVERDRRQRSEGNSTTP